MLRFETMGLLEAVAELLKSIWDGDRRVRSESVLGESEFCREGGKTLALVLIALLVLVAGIAIWWWLC